MIDQIFWDNDGILVDTEKVYMQATREVMAAAGVDLTESLYYQYFLASSGGTWHLLRQKGASDSEIAALRDQRNRRYGELLAQQNYAIPGAEEALKTLSGEFKMAVVTSSRRDHFEIIHRNTGFDRYFEFVICSDDVRHTKPDPEAYLRALRRSSANAMSSIVIEDSPRGLQAAMSAGIPCWVIPTALTRGGDFGGAEKMLKSVLDIVPLLCK